MLTYWRVINAITFTFTFTFTVSLLMADIFEMHYRHRLSVIDLDGNIATDIADIFLTISLSIIGEIFREYQVHLVNLKAVLTTSAQITLK